MTYAEQLKDPRWQKMRLEVLNRDDWACRVCDDEESTLHVHHTMYKYGAAPWDYDPGLLVTLCKNCHTEETKNLKEARDRMILMMSECGFRSKEFGALADALDCGAINDSQFSPSDFISAISWFMEGEKKASMLFEIAGFCYSNEVECIRDISITLKRKGV